MMAAVAVVLMLLGAVLLFFQHNFLEAYLYDVIVAVGGGSSIDCAKIVCAATNYDGDKKIKFYQVHDEKGDAIWAEFDSFQVSVGGVELRRAGAVHWFQCAGVEFKPCAV